MNNLNGEILMLQERHLPVVLLLDTSDLTKGDFIERLNKGLYDLFSRNSTHGDMLSTVDLAIIEFNDSAHVVQGFTPLVQCKPMCFSAGGNASMGEGINLSIEVIKEQVRLYNYYGVNYYRPWIFMITCGNPSDDILSAQENLKKSGGQFKLFTVTTPGYDNEVIRAIANTYIAFDRDIFPWLIEIFKNTHLIIYPEYANTISVLPPE